VALGAVRETFAQRVHYGEGKWLLGQAGGGVGEDTQLLGKVIKTYVCGGSLVYGSYRDKNSRDGDLDGAWCARRG
jgi:hypothetical protein